jgi:predicted double-glycine peptidase
MDTVIKLKAALGCINQAIDIVAQIDGMEHYAEELNLQAVGIEMELDDLESLLERLQDSEAG